MDQQLKTHIHKRLTYKDLFDDEPHPFASYLAGISTEDLHKAIGFFIKQASPERVFHGAKQVIARCISNPDIGHELIAKIGAGDTILNMFSSLTLAEHILQMEFQEESVMPTSDFDLNVLKAYLLLNDKQEKIEEHGFANLPPEDHQEHFPALMLSMNFHDSDFNNYDLTEILAVQIVKSVTFFKYLDSRDEMTPHMNMFLKMFNCDDWQEWLKYYFTLIIPVFNDNGLSYLDITIPKDEFYDKSSNYLDELRVGEDFSRMDFINLRSSPLLKIADGRYRIINKLFLVEKLFKSIQFLFSLTINGALPKGQRIKDFRGDHCDKFSEQTLLYQIIGEAFPPKWKHVPGERFKDRGYKAEPDYYLRNKKDVFIFESKDVVLKGEEKQSRDFSVLKPSLEAKFYFELKKSGKRQNKAILQIIKNIKRIFEKYYTEVDNKYDVNKIRIYPILITHDRQFDSLGMNSLLQIWFQNELTTLKKEYDTTKVFQLTVVNIDTFILYRDHFRSGVLRLDGLIESYHAFIATNKTTDIFMAFSTFVTNEVGRKEIDHFPKIVLEYAREVF